jgi:hypothetical protein
MLREIADPEEVNEKKRKKFQKNKSTPPIVTLVKTHPSPRMSPTTPLQRKTYFR